jgi:hypothetical protein
MQNPKVREDSETYAKYLEDIVPKNADVIGIVMVINGKINSADTYGSSELFVKLWPKLLIAAAIEAVAESSQSGQSQTTLTTNEIESFFETSENATIVDEQTVTDRIHLISRESPVSVYLMTLDRDSELHRNYLTK